ncbi:hypothetical protein [Catenulispora rubra]|uniref:hypothetical protein n=1 Tax=Catenulispora rubra TaxID=280293 RepID=UPI0018922632|nr:hypothetical protein [Catenulispora rubra]
MESTVAVSGPAGSAADDADFADCGADGADDEVPGVGCVGDELDDVLDDVLTASAQARSAVWPMPTPHAVATATAKVPVLAASDRIRVFLDMTTPTARKCAREM